MFRKDFLRIGEDLLPLVPKIPVMLFTATAPPATQMELKKALQMEDPKVVEVNPDRQNVAYIKHIRPPSNQTKDHLDQLISNICSNLKAQGSDYPQTILYTDTECIAYFYSQTEKKLGIQHQYQGEHIPENRVFAQYHSEYTPSMKEHIVTELCKPQSKIRIVYATVALGMGLDAPHVRHVIHYKPPTSLEKYFQETGRAGRDQQPARATLYFNKTDIRHNRPGITKGMISFCENDTKCLREFMLGHFGHSAPPNRDAFDCCCVCNPDLLTTE